MISRSPTPRNRILVEFSCLESLSCSSSCFPLQRELGYSRISDNKLLRFHVLQGARNGKRSEPNSKPANIGRVVGALNLIESS